jgi:hypothetical protein
VRPSFVRVKYLEPVLTLAKLKGTIHGLRHAFSTLLAEAGTPLKTISTTMGHAKSSITLDTCQHGDPSAQRAAIDRLETLPAKNDGGAKLNHGLHTKSKKEATNRLQTGSVEPTVADPRKRKARNYKLFIGPGGGNRTRNSCLEGKVGPSPRNGNLYTAMVFRPGQSDSVRVSRSDRLSNRLSAAEPCS